MYKCQFYPNYFDINHSFKSSSLPAIHPQFWSINRLKNYMLILQARSYPILTEKPVR